MTLVIWEHNRYSILIGHVRCTLSSQESYVSVLLISSGGMLNILLKIVDCSSDEVSVNVFLIL